METLTPFQRVVTMTIGLVFTAAIIVFVFPWATREIAQWLPPTATPAPVTATPRFQATPTEVMATRTPGVTLTPPPARLSLEPLTYIPQGAGNNGPASLAMVLGFWGYTDTQEAVASLVRPGELDKDVAPEDLAGYAQSRGLSARLAVNGNVDVLRKLLAQGFPVLVTRWITGTEGTPARHYQVARGYDDAARTLAVHDSLGGADMALSYDGLDETWQPLDYTYLVVYPAAREGHVRAVLGPNWDEETMWKNALAHAEQELQGDANNAFAWLNRGSASLALKQYSQAQEAFDKAQALGLPAHMLWYRLEPFECLLALGKPDQVLALTQYILDEGAVTEAVHWYRARAHLDLKHIAEAGAEYREALEIHPAWKPAEEGLKILSAGGP